MPKAFTRRFVDQCTDEYVRMKRSEDALQASVLETALFLEDVFGICVSDSDISSGFLISSASIRAFVLDRVCIVDEEESDRHRTTDPN